MSDDMAIPEGVPTRAVVLGRGVLDRLPAALARINLAPPIGVLLILDANTRSAAGERARGVLQAAGYRVHEALMQPDRHDHVPGSIEQVRQVVRLCEAKPGEVDLVLGVGSGVLNDLGKLASRLASKRYVSVATAASMNGYGSPIAAIVEQGVKKTLPAAPTEAIVADLDVIAAAPIDMTRSGFADLLSKASATADWRLASLVRDEAYDPRPHELLDPIVKQCQRQARAIGQADPEALRLLMQGLIGGGFAMTLAGHSSPASGGEHLLSHYWDMQAHAHGGRHYSHGFQVAIGTRLSCALYGRLLKLEAKEIDVEHLARRWEPWETRREKLQAVHGDLFEAVEPEAKKQQMTPEAYRAELEKIRAQWDALRAELAPMVESPEQMRHWHEAAGVPTDPAAVGQTRASVRHTLLHAADVRARYTVLDLARELDVLERWADDLLDECGI